MSIKPSQIRFACLALFLAHGATVANAQSSPSILTQLTQSGGGQNQGGAGSGVGPSIQPASLPVSPAPMPAMPVDNSPLATSAVVFGSQMFSGRFSALSYTGFNPDYQVAVGDNISLRMWGAVVYEATQTVDPQGNIFVPNAGPVQVLGVRNQDLNKQVEDQVKRTFKANVGVYATLGSAQPVKVYVTGFVRAPGLYGGLSSDSALAFLDKAGGIDPDRGSYLQVQVMRGGKLKTNLNLYEFLLEGKLDKLQFQDGDTVVVKPRQFAVTVQGEAQNAYKFEISRTSITAGELFKLAQPKASATHLSILRNTGVELRSEYYPLGKAADVVIQSGDLVTFTADKYPTTLLVRVEGAQLGERSLVLSNGARLKDLVARLSPSGQADLDSLQLFRKSVQLRQKKSLDISLRNLETAALTARSATSEEAALRKTEADLMTSFITRAQQVQPLGQVVLADRAQAMDMLLEDGDVVVVPEKRNLVLLSGEVLFPNAMVYKPNASVEEYITMAGGYTQSADSSKQIVLRPDGSVAPQGSVPKPGDEIMILPKIDSKNIEITRGVTQILYQLAIAAKVAFGL